jgi:hypothetical protein
MYMPGAQNSVREQRLGKRLDWSLAEQKVLNRKNSWVNCYTSASATPVEKNTTRKKPLLHSTSQTS